MDEPDGRCGRRLVEFETNQTVQNCHMHRKVLFPFKVFFF